ncbi:glycosyltransferase family 1 protein [Sphingomonadales bacterium 58]|uniref:glycosyltransferase family 4 protein n=1 Tax=Sphingobium sp. S8 TaxID=2758385 RepID=UPI001919D20B|nr:glycosyltransferase family 1 protein [Sphingobium sp. S8]MBY2958971.1 glycosyltransferase family 1 protein [Sphingomonadales bacterium 58]CAD7338156.1 GDP-mannose-dependent alpha-mannosyltransferase [Sphingobium sp. S8]
MSQSDVERPLLRITGRPLRIALFSGNYNCIRDGANQALNRLVAYLLDRQAQVRIYSPTTPRTSIACVGQVVPVPSIAIPGRSEYRLALGLPRTIRRDLANFAPDIVHLSAPDWLGRSAQRHARLNGTAVVASLHTRFETYLSYYRLGALRRPMERYLHRFYSDCDRILAPTAPIAAELAGQYGSGRVSIWSRGVDRASFGPALRDEEFRNSLGYKPEDVVPLFFGRLVIEKGLQIFVETVMRTRAAGRHVRPLVIGDGPARAWLAQRLPNANFLGHLEGVALGRAIASADVLINPSITEAFGNVNLEAMASGLAIISADVPSASTLINNGRTGLLVAPLSNEAYADTLLELMADPTRRTALGRSAQLAASSYDWDDALAQVVEAYRGCLKRDDSLSPKE